MARVDKAGLQQWTAVSFLLGLISTVYQGRSQGGSWGARDPPFVSLFVSKQPTIFRWQFGEYPMYESVWPPLWKILATPMYIAKISNASQWAKRWLTTYIGSLVVVVVVVSKLTMLASLMFPKASTYKSAKIIKGLPLSEDKEQRYYCMILRQCINTCWEACPIFCTRIWSYTDQTDHDSLS